MYVLVSGSGRMKLDDEVLELNEWDVIRIGNETMRNFEAGPDGAELLVFGAGAPGDTEMAGWWAD